MFCILIAVCEKRSGGGIRSLECRLHATALINWLGAVSSRSKMTKQMVNVRVNYMNATIEFMVQPNITGQELFDQVIKMLNIREFWYFGLKYISMNGNSTWLALNKKVMKQDVKKRSTAISFDFRVKFYPESVGDELIQNVTIKLFYLQTKDAILSEVIYCPPEESILLASFALQAKYGDYKLETLGEGNSFQMEQLIPLKIIARFNEIMLDEWKERVVAWWKEYEGMSEELAMLEYLKIAENLAMFGVDALGQYCSSEKVLLDDFKKPVYIYLIEYFRIQNKRGTELELGIDALGMNIYYRDNHLSPKVGFSWSEISKISFNGNKLVIKPVGKHVKNIVFRNSNARLNEQILSLCIGNHQLYIRRRKPDSAEITLLKQEASEKRNRKDMFHHQLSEVKKTRELAEMNERQIEMDMESYENELERTQQELFEARSKIEHLQEQLHVNKKEVEQKKHDVDLLNASVSFELSKNNSQREYLNGDESDIIGSSDHHNASVTHVSDSQRTEGKREEEELFSKKTLLTKNLIKELRKKMKKTHKMTEMNGDAEIKLHSSSSGQLSMLNDDKKATDDSMKECVCGGSVDAQSERFNTLIYYSKFRRGNTRRRIDEYENM